MTHQVIVIGICAVLGSGTVAAQDAIIPVYIVQPSAPFADQALRNRQESTRDLAAALHSMKSLKLVDDRAMAVVVVEVLDRREILPDRVGRVRPEGDVGRWTDRVKTLRVKFTAGDFSTEMDASSEEAHYTLLPTWKAAAALAAEGIDRWIRRHPEKLVPMR